MARPLSELHDLVLEQVRGAGPVTAREVAHALRLNVKATCQYLHRMNRAGTIEVVDRLRVDHMKRPAMRYRVRVAEPSEQAWSVLASWPASRQQDQGLIP
jgi:hypothetical protein